MKKQNKNQSGFTLVELAIVLVIIGLLISGILVAQSMINTTKVQALARQIASFDAAVATFGDRYKGLPGDVASVGTTALGGTTAGNGNGDGIITDTNGALLEFSGEIGTFWNALSMTGLSTEGQGTGGNTFVQATTSAANVIILGANANIPKAKAGSANSGFIAWGTAARNYYQMISTANLGSGAAWTSSTATAAALKPSDALALDTKIDDATANTGYVQGGWVLAAGLSVAPAASGCYSSAAYTVTTTTNACDPTIRMGVSTGDPR